MILNTSSMTDYDKIDQIKKIIEELLARMHMHAEVQFEDSITKGLVFNINSPDSFLLIGRQGVTLQSLQIIVQALAARKFRDQPLWFTLDVDDYKMKREWYLRETAKQAIEQAKRVGRPQALEPMPSFDRRYVHAYIQEHYPEAESESIGQEPYRKLVVRLKNNPA